jgi:hypothetical protein
MAVDENVSEAVKLVVFDDIVGGSRTETVASARPSAPAAAERSSIATRALMPDDQ